MPIQCDNGSILFLMKDGKSEPVPSGGGGNPGSNLLKQALRLIRPQFFYVVPFNSRERNEVGTIVDIYDVPVLVKGSVQAVPQDVYQRLGLDFQKNYRVVYALRDVAGLARNKDGDRVIYGGKTWQITSDVPWFDVDGWDAFIMVEIRPERNPRCK